MTLAPRHLSMYIRLLFHVGVPSSPVRKARVSLGIQKHAHQFSYQGLLLRSRSSRMSSSNAFERRHCDDDGAGMGTDRGALQKSAEGVPKVCPKHSKGAPKDTLLEYSEHAPGAPIWPKSTPAGVPWVTPKANLAYALGLIWEHSKGVLRLYTVSLSFPIPVSNSQSGVAADYNAEMATG
ncbi:hypothetical protein K438DRAFT_1933364 [Mycena galopus ATCC 62051]|nr:hypothetical protein K438DRAFT_1933364 [Mycena galopus ATCC 62051]